MVTSKEWKEYTSGNLTQIGELWGNDWLMDDDISASLTNLPPPTEWMPLPEPPTNG